MRLLIKNGIVVDPSQNMNGIYDILIEEGKIKDIGTINIEENCDVINAEGLYVVPGLIDMHVHLRDPGFQQKETIQTGGEAAAAGGFTSIVCMPNTKPVIDNIDTIQYINNEAMKAPVNINIMGSITKDLKGDFINDFKTMKEAGVVGITDDGMTVTNSRVMYEALTKAKENGLLTSVHCEDKDLVYDNSIHRGNVSKNMGLLGRPNISEDIIVERDIMLAESVGARIHIQHISSMNSIELVKRAKKRGVEVTCEVTPHHFTLTDTAVIKHGPNAKMSPPLRSEEDREAILRGLADGNIDVIATDHAPHAEEDKNKGILDAANGIIGLETALGLALNALVGTKKIELKKLVELMSLNPARLLGIDKGTLKVGKDADITIIDLNKTWTVDKNNFKSKGKNTPFHDMTLKGKAVSTIVKGEVVYSEI